MIADLWLAAYDIHGKELWGTWVEPPSYINVEDGILYLDVMGKKSSFPIKEGPPPEPPPGPGWKDAAKRILRNRK